MKPCRSGTFFVVRMQEPVSEAAVGRVLERDQVQQVTWHWPMPGPADKRGLGSFLGGSDRIVNCRLPTPHDDDLLARGNLAIGKGAWAGP